jgi:hypothetical protein
VVARSKVWVCVCLFPGIVVSNPSRDMNVCLLWMLCVVQLEAVAYRVGGCLGFDKVEPNFQFRGNYINNNLIRIRVSFICKLSGTPDYGTTAPRSPFSLPSVLNWICWNTPHPHPRKNPGYALARGLCYGQILRPEESYWVCICRWMWSGATVTLCTNDD